MIAPAAQTPAVISAGSSSNAWARRARSVKLETVIPDGPFQGRRFRLDSHPYTGMWFARAAELCPLPGGGLRFGILPADEPITLRRYPALTVRALE